MARPLRLQIPGEFFHVLARGNARQPVFLDDVDRTVFLDLFQDVVERHGFRCHAYCLMGNHYHLLVQLSEPNLSRGLRQLNGVYGQSFNRRHGRVGHVFSGRFKSLLVDRDAYLLEVTRYLALNPVRAGLVATPEAWPWSHHRAMSGLEPARPLLTREEILKCFDSRDRNAAQAAYRVFVESAGGDDERVSTAIARGGILGDQALRSRVSSTIEMFAGEPEILLTDRIAHRPPLDTLFDVQVGRQQRNQRIRVAYERYGYTIGQIARQLGLGRSTISRALHPSPLSAAPAE